MQTGQHNSGQCCRFLFCPSIGSEISNYNDDTESACRRFCGAIVADLWLGYDISFLIYIAANTLVTSYFILFRRIYGYKTLKSATIKNNNEIRLPLKDEGVMR